MDLDTCLILANKQPNIEEIQSHNRSSLDPSPLKTNFRGSLCPSPLKTNYRGSLFPSPLKTNLTQRNSRCNATSMDNLIDQDYLDSEKTGKLFFYVKNLNFI